MTPWCSILKSYRRTLSSVLLDCRRTRPLSTFAEEAASYQLPSEAGYQEVGDLDPNMDRVGANHHDPPLLEPSGCMSLLLGPKAVATEYPGSNTNK